MNKLALVNFTHSHEKANNVKPLILTQPTGTSVLTHQIKPSPNAKLLGVILDSKLNWSTQFEKVHEKAVKWTSVFKCYMKAASGIRMIDARKLYNMVAIPKICYAANIWFQPRKMNGPNTNPGSNGP